jgi:antitoxin PrlF
MAPGRSIVTLEGAIPVPDRIREKLGTGPGSVIEWEENGDAVVVRKARYTSLDIHRAVFGDNPPKPITVEEMDEGIRRHFREKYARR